MTYLIMIALGAVTYPVFRWQFKVEGKAEAAIMFVICVTMWPWVVAICIHDAVKTYLSNRKHRKKSK